MGRMNYSVLLVIALAFGITHHSYANGNIYPDTEHFGEEDVSVPDKQTELKQGTKPDPQRLYCKKYWNSYYGEHNIDIKVSTRGEFDEVVVFNCPQCSLEEHFVDPFLDTVSDGYSGRERIQACGFEKAVFIGAKGIREIEKDIQE